MSGVLVIKRTELVHTPYIAYINAREMIRPSESHNENAKREKVRGGPQNRHVEIR